MLETVYLQVGLNAPTESVVEYLQNLKLEFRKSNGNLGVCWDQAKDLEKILQESYENLGQANMVIQMTKPEINSMEKRIKGLEKKISQNKNLLQKLQEFQETQKQNLNQKLEVFEQGVEAFTQTLKFSSEMPLEGVSFIEFNQKSDIVTQVLQSASQARSQILKEKKKVTENWEYLFEKQNKLEIDLQSVIEYLELKLMETRHVLEADQENVGKLTAFVKEIKGKIGEQNQILLEKKNFCQESEQKVVQQNQQNQENIGMINTVLQYLDSDFEEIKKQAAGRKPEHALGGPMEDKLINVD